MSAVRSVTQYIVASCREHLPVQATHPVGEFVVEYAAAAAGRMSELVDLPAAEFAREYWSPRSNVWHSISAKAKSCASGMSRQQIQRAERRLSASAELADRQVQDRTQTALAAPGPGVELLAFIECARYDEATSLLSVAQPIEDYLLAAGISSGDLPAGLLGVLAEDIPKESVPAKIFQTESRWVALLAATAADPAMPKQYTLISSDTITCPQVLQRNNTECVARALAVGSTCRIQTVSKFGWKMRLVCSDRGSTNMAAERLIHALRGDWHLLFFPCEIHMSTGAQGKGLLLMDNMVSKLIRTALSLRMGGWMRMFRRCMLHGDHRHLADLGRRAQRGGHSVQTKGDVYVSESRLALAAD